MCVISVFAESTENVTMINRLNVADKFPVSRVDESVAAACVIDGDRHAEDKVKSMTNPIATDSHTEIT